MHYPRWHVYMNFYINHKIYIVIYLTFLYCQWIDMANMFWESDTVNKGKILLIYHRIQETNKWSEFLWFVQFLNRCSKRPSRELTSTLLTDAFIACAILQHNPSTYPSTTQDTVTSLNDPSSPLVLLKTSIKKGQVLPQSLLVALTWESPDFCFQLVSHL